MLVQLLGFAHPRDLFGSGNLIDIFRRVWSFVASICFRSQEAFAAHCGTPDAMQALRVAPLLPVTKKQKEMLGDQRAQQCEQAQLDARGLKEAVPEADLEKTEFPFWTPAHYGDRSLPASTWEARVCSL